ncbi:MAG: type I 3-dehydroquinate dehydratase [Chthoniobacteraceae bacterium]|nr:type I 3-dehydroquinate dehydratase [Chthoniobacteraceae bacterium]
MSAPLSPGRVVGTIHSPAALTAALKLPRGAVDFLELRVDAFAEAGKCDLLERSVERLRAPLLLTVRHPLEGGAGRLGAAQRRALYRRFLPQASLVDVELRSAKALEDVLAAARSQGAQVILSHHDFRKTPTLAKLQALRRAARRAGADVFKVAATANGARDAAVLLDFLTARGASAPALAVMGMGTFGKVSRLVLARAGSVLNYGFLDRAQVPGQWPAELLKKRLAELAL